MPRRSLAQSSFFDPEFVMPDCLEPGTVPWLLARCRSTLFPSWLLSGWRGEGRRGRDAWPAVTLLTLLFLRWSEGSISRLGSTRRAQFDVQWRAALGLNLGTQTPDEKTLREFEAFLRERHPACGVPRYLMLHEHIVRRCVEAGVVGSEACWAIDSTPMWCYGAVLDTVRMLGEGTRMLAGQWAKVIGSSLEQVSQRWELPHLLAKSIKGHFRIDWRDPGQRSEVVEAVARGAIHAVEQVRGGIDAAPQNRRGRLLRRCRQLMHVIEQDIEADSDGRLVIARRVAQDRIVSLTDPSARHGRKSNSHSFSGFKLHLLGDIVSGLIASVTVTSGNRHDSSVAHRLIRRAKDLCNEIELVLGDTAYGGATLRHRVEVELKVKLLAPPPPVPVDATKGLPREAFAIDFAAQTATCPAGVTTAVKRRSWFDAYQAYVTAYRWPAESCGTCPLKQRCLSGRKGGHFLRLHPHEEQLRQAREQWKDDAVRESYRQRSQCERLVGQIVRHGGRHARGWGLGAAQLQAHLIAMRCNLQLLARALAEHERAQRPAA
jgi:hypothetical protein